MADAAWSFAPYQPALPKRPGPVEARLTEATPQDVGPLAALQADARGGTAREWAGRIERAMEREDGAVVAARVAGELAGYANVAFLAEHPVDAAPGGFYLTGVTVAPRWRRRALGTALTRWRTDWVWQREAQVWCFVSARNGASLDLHRALGFSAERTGTAFQGVTFAGGRGLLLTAHRPGAAPPPR